MKIRKILTLVISVGLVFIATLAGAANNADELCKLAKNAEKAKNYDAVIKYGQEAAEKGKIEAYGLVGIGYIYKGDYAKAKVWFEKGAMAGDAMAMNFLGGIELKDKNINKAREWYQKAADAGEPKGLINLASTYTKEAPAKARQYGQMAIERYKTLAKSGNVKAMCDLGNCYGDTFFAKGVIEFNQQEARKWWQAAYNKGLDINENYASSAMNRLGNCCIKGLGGPKDLKTAETIAKMMSKADSEFTVARGEINLGVICEEEKKYFDAIKHYRVALDIIDSHDIGFSFTSTGGVGGIANRAGICCLQLKNNTLAEKFFRESAEKYSDEIGMFSLGLLYETAYKNKNEAVKWYKKSAAAGSKDAINRLKALGGK